MAEVEEQELAERMSWEEVTEADRRGLLEHSREFLDLFWDIAKEEQQTRLEATEKLLEYLRARPEGSEMKYALKRLITGLGMMREHARPCYSLALAQLLQCFEDISLLSILQQIQEKYKLDSLTKATMRPSLFGNLFGVLALFQSGRLVKDLDALLECVKVLQALAQHHNHLQEQPRRALVDILSEVPDNLWQGLLPKVLSTDLDVILSSPEHLELFLLARKKAPAKLQKLMGSVNLFSNEYIPRLVEVLRRAAASMKKEQKLPPVTLGMLRLALEEDKFPQFWKQVVEQGLLQKQLWPVNYMCFRLLGTALPLLSKEQLQLVLRGDLARLMGEHMVTSQIQNKFKFLPELTKLVVTFLEGSQDDPEKQLAVLVDLTSITNQGLPAIPTFWHVVRFLSPQAFQGYVAWLQEMFIQPKLDSLLDFSTGVQKKAQKAAPSMPGRAVFRLRKWIIHRLVSMIDHMVQEKDEALINQLARFCLFHSFFKTKKPVAQIPETKHQFSVPLEARDREIISDGFFSLLQALSSPVREAAAQALGGQLWTHRLLQLANTLLNHSRNVTPVTPFTTQQREAWDQMLQTLKELEARSSEAKATAFQHLLLLVGINLFKSPAESCDLLGDIQACIKKSMEETAQRPRAKKTNSEEPPWVEVMVEILLTLLSKPSHLMRRVARNVFGHICSHLTHRALELILVVVNPESSQDAEDNVVVTDDAAEEQDKDKDDEDKNSDSEDEEEEDESEEERDKDVDPGFREQLMEVLRAGKALGEGDSEDDGEELDDEAMMALDKNLASLFAEQKLRIQARQDGKLKLQKEKALRRDFQIRVLDLIEVLVSKHPENALILELIEPLLSIIRRSSGGSKQERDLLHKTARILTENLFRTRQCYHDVGARADAVHAQLEQLVQQASRQADSSIAFYYFNASLYLLRVLKMSPAPKSVPKKRQKKQKASPENNSEGPQITSCLDLMRVTSAYSAALSSFLTKRNSPLTIPMFLCLFSRHPMICKNLVPVMVQHIAGPTRPHNQVQACQLLQKTLCISELKVCFEDAEWEQLISGIVAQAAKNLQALGTPQTKPEHQREASSLELLNNVLRTISYKKLTVDLTGLLGVLQSQQQKMTENLQQGEHANTSSRLQDLYWQAMKYLGAQRPKLEKDDTKKVPSIPQSPISMKQKKKGFLPETKKRKKRKAEDMAQEAPSPAATAADPPPSTGKKRKKMKAKLPAQAQVNGTPPAKSPVPSDSPAKTPKQQKQQAPKPAQVSEAIPISPAESVAEKPHLKPLPKKRISGKSPLSPLPRKKARMSLATRGPLLFQFGAKKKKVKA
ncbi:myb-binding protein 1A [Ochotona princeps]|uniref:myb-binding protein 1A n=1 Tax=Ochotona princeps TaxID=9978 RepID=UPI002714F2A3|nr:myb-binding protein 1A [Ochotona princeps]